MTRGNDVTPAVVIIGGGQAGAQASMSLRQGGYDGAIHLIGEEPSLPYQRPPLSKAYMKGEFEAARLYFRPQDWYQQNNIVLHLGQQAIAIDPKERVVSLSDETALEYEHLILATGSRPRQVTVPGGLPTGVFSLRTLADVDKIRPRMIKNGHLLIVGAGYIGLEAAAIARQLGMAVTVVEMADRVLARVTTPVMSEYFEALHRAQGVEILTGAGLDRFVGEQDRLTGAILTDGQMVKADLAIVGIGILPNEELALAAGLACDGGIIVDQDGRTSHPHIYAAGDCTRRPLAYHGGTARLESVHNAIEQGKLVAAVIAGAKRPMEDCPWFWSDQYHVKLQIAGLSVGYDRHVLRGDPSKDNFAVFYLREGVLIAVDAVNSPPEFLASKKMIMKGVSPDPAQLGDPSVPMQQIAAAALKSA